MVSSQLLWKVGKFIDLKVRMVLDGNWVLNHWAPVINTRTHTHTHTEREKEEQRCMPVYTMGLEVSNQTQYNTEHKQAVTRARDGLREVNRAKRSD